MLLIRERYTTIHIQSTFFDSGVFMLEKLKKLNPEIPFYDVGDDEFASFGKVINGLDSKEIIAAAKKIENPENGSSYLPSVEAFEELEIADTIRDDYFGTLPTQIGYCWGHSNFLNATEWHKSSEINIAITPLVLILGHIWDIKDGTIDSSEFKAFYLPAGTAVEVYSTTLHFCPCEVEKEGFGCVVALPEGTNTDLEKREENSLLFRKNKWIIRHAENETLKNRGVVAGIMGTNFEIKY